MRVIIVLSHNINETITHFKFLEDDFIIGVERGILLLLEKEIHFHMAIGDFDSILEEEYQKIKKLNNLCILPMEKDVSDLEAALEKAYLMKSENCIVLGGIQGSRIEHFYNNVLLLRKYNFLWIDDFSKIYIIDKSTEIKKETYKFCSFFSIVEESVLTLTGFKYPLKDYLLSDTNTICISNEINNEIGNVELKEGKLIIILSK